MEFAAFVDSLDLTMRNWASALGWPLEGLLRLALAALAGGLVGLEREVRGRQAGFRTNILVCVGSCLTMIVSIQFAFYDWPAGMVEDMTLRLDPARIAYGVMGGVGFLGAGTIIHNKGSVRGLTTAAALWCVAAMGLSSGFGLYLLTLLSMLLIVAVLWFLDYVEDVLPKVRYRTVTVRRRWEVGVIAQTVQHFQSAGLDVTDASFERTPDLLHADISLKVAFVDKQQYYNFERKLEGDTGYQLMATREG